MKEVKVTYCKDLLPKLILVIVLFCGVFSFSMYSNTSSLVLQKTTTELFSPEGKAISKRVVSYKQVLRQIEFSVFVSCYFPNCIHVIIAHNLLEKVSFREALKRCYYIESFGHFIYSKTVSHILDDEVFVIQD